MNARVLALALLAVASHYAAAAVPQSDVLVIDCADPRLPSQQQVARFAGIDNFGQAYAARTRLMADAQRACKRGAGQVRLVRERQAGGRENTVAVVPAAQR